MTATFAQLDAAVSATGIWSEGRRHGQHAFRLSPQCYRITDRQRTELDQLSRAVQRTLLGVSRLLAIAADSSLHDGTGAYSRLWRLLTRGTPYGLSAIRPSNIPLLCKADLMVDAAGEFRIAELDATNPRSWGYSVIGRRLCDQIAPQAARLPGVASVLAEHLQRNQVDHILFLYGHTQRFYEPELRIIAAELSQCGIRMEVRNEIEIPVNGRIELPVPCTKRGVQWLVDLPPMNQNKPLIDWLTSATINGQLAYVIPPKQPLSSKALLAVLSNRDSRFEPLLASQIRPADLELVRRYLPETYLIGKDEPEPPLDPSVQPCALKHTVSSGMKGVCFSDDPTFNQTLTAARREPTQYILQAAVNQQQSVWPVYEPNGCLRETGGWRLRLTAYMTHRGLADLAVTARQDVRVHGSTDAIVSGTVVV